MLKLIKDFGRDCGGATAIEYALLAMCMAVAIVGAVAALGTKVNDTYSNVNSALN